MSEAERLNLARLHFRRTRVAQELLDTEGTYVRNLAIVIKKFQNPLFQIARTKKQVGFFRTFFRENNSDRQLKLVLILSVILFRSFFQTKKFGLFSDPST